MRASAEEAPSPPGLLGHSVPSSGGRAGWHEEMRQVLHPVNAVDTAVTIRVAANEDHVTRRSDAGLPQLPDTEGRATRLPQQSWGLTVPAAFGVARGAA